MHSGGCVLLSAISEISSGRRLARRAPAAMRSWMAAMFSAMDIRNLTTQDTEYTEEFFRSSVYSASSVVYKLTSSQWAALVRSGHPRSTGGGRSSARRAEPLQQFRLGTADARRFVPS